MSIRLVRLDGTIWQRKGRRDGSGVLVGAVQRRIPQFQPDRTRFGPRSESVRLTLRRHPAGARSSTSGRRRERRPSSAHPTDCSWTATRGKDEPTTPVTGRYAALIERLHGLPPLSMPEFVMSFTTSALFPTTPQRTPTAARPQRPQVRVPVRTLDDGPEGGAYVRWWMTRGENYVEKDGTREVPRSYVAFNDNAPSGKKTRSWPAMQRAPMV